MIKAVFFDLWNTLATSSAEWRQAYNEAGYHKCKDHDEIFENKINTRGYVDEEELATIMCKYFGGLNKKRVSTLLKSSKAEFFPDVKEGIKKLKEKGFLIGIISNTHNLEIKKLKFDFADVVILSSEVGIVKPNKKIFHLACKELGVKPDECIFVGDNYEMDYLGAKNAGMTPILIDRKGLHPKKAQIKDLNELLEVLEKK